VLPEERTWFLALWACSSSSSSPAVDDLSRVFSVSSSRRETRLISRDELAW